MVVQIIKAVTTIIHKVVCNNVDQYLILGHRNFTAKHLQMVRKTELKSIF